MGSQTREKLNQLQQVLPEGLIVDSGWLERHGVSRQLRRKYVMNGWLQTLARGVFRRPTVAAEQSVDWQHLVISLSGLENVPVAAGGRTALQMQGYTHYVSSSGSSEAHLYSNGPLPGWVSRVPLDAKLVLHNARRLFSNRDVPASFTVGDAAQSAAQENGFAYELGDWKYPFIISLPERSILELLDEVPQRETFHQADVLMEGLRNLSPRRLQGLLKDCKSVKVKRLFFWFAERHNHPWLPKIDRSNIDLGKGKRMLVRGGKLDPKYNITVPEKMDAGV
jgi:hypothetical protein